MLIKKYNIEYTLQAESNLNHTLWCGNNIWEPRLGADFLLGGFGDEGIQTDKIQAANITL